MIDFAQVTLFDSKCRKLLDKSLEFTGFEDPKLIISRSHLRVNFNGCASIPSNGELNVSELDISGSGVLETINSNSIELSCATVTFGENVPKNFLPPSLDFVYSFFDFKTKIGETNLSPTSLTITTSEVDCVEHSGILGKPYSLAPEVLFEGGGAKFII